MPTATALHCCRCACGCSADHCRTQLRRHQRQQIRTIHSGTAPSAAAPCASSSGSLLRNSCFARPLNQTGVQHEALSTSPALVRASARSRIPCLFRSKPFRCQTLQPLHQVSASQHAAPYSPSVIGCSPTRSVPDPSASVQTDSKYIGFHVGGFLQVAVSEAPPEDSPTAHDCVAGAPDTALRPFGTNLPLKEGTSDSSTCDSDHIPRNLSKVSKTEHTMPVTEDEAGHGNGVVGLECGRSAPRVAASNQGRDSGHALPIGCAECSVLIL